jgi:hypothetical protein
MNDHVTRAAALLAAAALLLALAPGSARGAALKEVGSFEAPIYVTSDPDDSGRLLVAERQGLIVESEGQEQTVWADLQDLVLCCEGERGLLSIVPAPDFHESDLIYVAYTGEAAAGGDPGDVHLDALHHGAGALIREQILTVPHSTETNHNSGQLQFGPDGYLYMTVGDGGGGDDPFNSGQNLDTLLGKMLRIEPHPGATPAYTSPRNNPFAESEARDEIWAYGLRNAWRFSFDRATGDLIIADVGQDAREEIDFAPAPDRGAGANYGWDCREGLIAHTVDASPACEGASGFTEPVFDYPHAGPEEQGAAYGCSIIGGYVVRDPDVPSLDGRYLYGDFCTGDVRSIDLSAADPGATDRAEPGLTVPLRSMFSFGEDSRGRVYVMSGDGTVFYIVESAETGVPGGAPQAAAPAPVAGARPLVRLREVRRRGRVVALIARVSPCTGNDGRRLLLRRGGRRYAAKRLNRRCVARFRVRSKRRETFRAVLPMGAGERSVRSRRVAVRPPRR